MLFVKVEVNQFQLFLSSALRENSFKVLTHESRRVLRQCLLCVNRSNKRNLLSRSAEYADSLDELVAFLKSELGHSSYTVS